MGLEAMTRHMDRHYQNVDKDGEVQAKLETNVQDEIPAMFRMREEKKDKDRKYYCPSCPASFALRRLLKVHLWKHYFDTDILEGFIKQNTAR